MRSFSRRQGWLVIAASIALLAGCSQAGSGPSVPPTGHLGASARPAASSGPGGTPGATPAATHLPLIGTIAFFDYPGDSQKSQIYVEAADGTNVRKLVTSTFDDRNPSISPDGRRVAFTRYVPDGAPLDPGGVFVVNIDGTGLVQLDILGEDVSWSPDGKQLVETRGLFDPGAAGPYNVGLWVMDADGSNKHQITLAGKRCSDTCVGGEQHNEGVWSPDGTRIAFKRDVYTKPEQFSIYTVAPDGSDLQRVTPEGMNVGDPAWSPDGSLIAFQSPPEANEGGEQNIFSIHPDGTGLKQLTAHLTSQAGGGQGTFHPSWSPDGRQILFSHDPGVITLLGDIFVMNADGTDVRVIAGTALNENWPNWGVVATP